MAEIHGQQQQQIKAFRNSWGGVAKGRDLSSSLSRWLLQLCDGGGVARCQETVIVVTNRLIPIMEVNDWCKSDPSTPLKAPCTTGKLLRYCFCIFVNRKGTDLLLLASSSQIQSSLLGRIPERFAPWLCLDCESSLCWDVDSRKEQTVPLVLFLTEPAQCVLYVFIYNACITFLVPEHPGHDA